jgi:hypothetical protein
MRKTLELEVDNYVGFCDDGHVEHLTFVGVSDDPIMHSIRSLEDMTLEFLDMRSIKGKLSDYHRDEAKALMNALEDSLALVKAALK